MGVFHMSHNYTCGGASIVGDAAKYVTPYAFPFVVQYSFIAAAVLLAMWKSIGKNPK
jgi:hypothetical protein